MVLSDFGILYLNVYLFVTEQEKRLFHRINTFSYLACVRLNGLETILVEKDFSASALLIFWLLC